MLFFDAEVIGKLSIPLCLSGKNKRMIAAWEDCERHRLLCASVTAEISHGNGPLQDKGCGILRRNKAHVKTICDAVAINDQVVVVDGSKSDVEFIHNIAHQRRIRTKHRRPMRAFVIPIRFPLRVTLGGLRRGLGLGCFIVEDVSVPPRARRHTYRIAKAGRSARTHSGCSFAIQKL
jgi:hypothetical protein